MPQSLDSMEAQKAPPPPPPPPQPKRKTPNQDLTSIEMEELQDYEIMELSSKSSDYKLLHRPQGSRASKEDQKNAKLKECVLHVQGKAIANMVVVMMKKAKILEV